MSPKKKTNRFRSKLQKTMTDEKHDVKERFSRADVALGSAQNEAKSPIADTRKKVIRDNFSMPEEDYALIEEIRERIIKEHALVRNKSEVLRAGLRVLSDMSNQDLKLALEAVRVLKPGRKPQQ